MSIEESVPELSIGYLTQQLDFCEHCPIAKALAYDIVRSVKSGQPVEPLRVATRFALYVSTCERTSPFPDPTPGSGEGPCMDINEQRKCYHGDLKGLNGDEKVLKIAEIAAPSAS